MSNNDTCGLDAAIAEAQKTADTITFSAGTKWTSVTVWFGNACFQASDRRPSAALAEALAELDEYLNGARS